MQTQLYTHLECPVCMNFFEEPVNLSCGHVLCKECALACKPRQCPTCRKRFNAKTLKINYTFKSLIEQVKINESKMEAEEEKRRKQQEEDEKRKKEIEEKRKKEIEEKRRIDEEKKKCYDILMNAYGKDRTKAESVMKSMKEKNVGVDLDETKFKSLFEEFKEEEEKKNNNKTTSKGRKKQTARKSTLPLVRAKPLDKEDEVIDLCDSDEDESDASDSAVPDVVDNDVIDLVSPVRKKRKKENLETFLSEQSDVIKCPRFSCNYRFIDEEIKRMKNIQIPFKCPKCNGEFCLNCRIYLRACTCQDPTNRIAPRNLNSQRLNNLVMQIVQDRLRL